MRYVALIFAALLAGTPATVCAQTQFPASAVNTRGQNMDVAPTALIDNTGKPLATSGGGIGVNCLSGCSGGAVASSIFSAQGLYTGGGGTALVSNTAIAVKGSAGSYFGIRTAKNTNTTDCYVLVYNVASGSVTVGTTVPTLTIPVPAGGYWEEKDINGEAFSTAMSVAVVMTTPTGSTAPTTAFGFDLIYK